MLLFISTDQEQVPEKISNTANDSEFVIQTNKKDLNKLINHYIEKEGLNGPVHYQVLLTDEVELFGEIQVFSQTLQLKMTFEPIALENGDLLLKQKELSLGDVKLPASYILKLIRDAYKFPDWVIIQPNDKEIYVALNKMRLNGGISVEAKSFDLVENNISMKMFVPVD